MGKRIWILSVLVSCFLITGATFIGGSASSGGLSGLTSGNMPVATGSSTIGDASGLTFGATRNPNLLMTIQNTKAGVEILENGATSNSTIGGAPVQFVLNAKDTATYYQLGYVTHNAGIKYEVANYLTAAGDISFDFFANGAMTGSISILSTGVFKTGASVGVTATCTTVTGITVSGGIVTSIAGAGC